MDKQYGQLIEPPVLSFSFGAPGWYVLAVFVLLGAALSVRVLVRWYNKSRYRRQALAAIGEMERYYVLPGMEGEMVYAVHMLMKRIAAIRYSRSLTAGIRADEWIAFLNRSRGKELFGSADGRLLAQLYEKEGDYWDVNGFLARAKEWVRKHKD
ncbi:MAG TPA: DUF4381 domain-containing protein [Puia sp.]|jgi:hypothetical protein